MINNFDGNEEEEEKKWIVLQNKAKKRSRYALSCTCNNPSILGHGDTSNFHVIRGKTDLDADGGFETSTEQTGFCFTVSTIRRTTINGYLMG